MSFGGRRRCSKQVARKARTKAAGDAKRESVRLAIAGWGNCNDCNYHNLGPIGRMRTDDPSQFGSVTRVLAFSREWCRVHFRIRMSCPTLTRLSF